MSIIISTINRYQPGTTVREDLRTMVSAARTGFLQRRTVVPNMARTWELPFDATATEVDAFRTEYETAKGASALIDFYPPGIAYVTKVRCVGFDVEAVSQVKYRVTLRLREDVRR